LQKTQGCATRPNPYGAHTGSDWDCSTHIDVVGRKFDIWVDNEQIMKEGKFLVEA
jgi:hypothetical protein